MAGLTSVLSLKLMVLMVLVQSVMAGVNIFYKLAMGDGMAASVIVAYRCLFAAAVLCPVAYFLNRKQGMQMTRTVLAYSFLSGLLGVVLPQNLYVSGFRRTSMTVASGIGNLGPLMTFVLAAWLRLEVVGIRTATGRLKVAGIAVALAGAMMLTFYKGTELHLWSSAVNLLADSRGSTAAEGSHVLIGVFMYLGSCLFNSMWLVLQDQMGHHIPCPYLSSALMYVMASVQAVAYGLFDHSGDWKAWRLGFDIKLLAVLYNGVVGSAVAATAVVWVVSKKGAVYTSMFSPITLIIVVFLGSVILGEKIHIGSVLGSVVIVAGLYLVLFGKMSEAAAAEDAKQEKLPTRMMVGDSGTKKGAGNTCSVHISPLEQVCLEEQDAEAMAASLGKQDCTTDGTTRHVLKTSIEK